MKKFTAFLAAIAIVSTVSCSNSSVSESSVPAETITVSQTMYKEEIAQLPEDLRSIGNIGYVEGKGVRLVYTDKDGMLCYSDYSEDTQPSASVELIEENGAFNKAICISDDGTVTILFEYVDSDAEIGAKDYYDKATMRLELHSISPEGDDTVTELTEIDRYFRFPDDSIKEISVIGDSYLIKTFDSVIVLDRNGELTDIWNNNEHIVYAADTDGNIVATSMKGYRIMDV